MKFSIKDFFSKRDQIRRKLRIWSHLLKKPLMVNFIFCAVKNVTQSSATCESIIRRNRYFKTIQLPSGER